jgi:hypothetical protein
MIKNKELYRKIIDKRRVPKTSEKIVLDTNIEYKIQRRSRANPNAKRVFTSEELKLLITEIIPKSGRTPSPDAVAVAIELIKLIKKGKKINDNQINYLKQLGLDNYLPKSQ